MAKQKRETTFSASVVLELPKGTERFVLVKETARHKSGLLNLPGGSEDRGDITLPNTAIREAKEETGAGDPANPDYDPDYGLDIQVEGLIGVYPHSTRSRHRLAVFSGLIIGGAMRPTLEHPTVDAFSIEEIDELYLAGRLRDERVHHAIHEYLGGLAVPIDSLSTAQSVRERRVVEL